LLPLALSLLGARQCARAQQALARPEPAVRWLHPAPGGARVLRTDALVDSRWCITRSDETIIPNPEQ
jgi:hypothetical protein